MTPYLHPLSGGLILALLVYVGTLGLRLRTARRDRAVLAARHARWAHVAYSGVLISWAAGVATLLWVRDDLSLASSLHFRSGTAMAVLLTGSVVTARLMQRGNRTAREIHPWLGAAAVLLAAAHAVTGLQLTP